jgi:hypothetical protein
MHALSRPSSCPLSSRQRPLLILATIATTLGAAMLGLAAGWLSTAPATLRTGLVAAGPLPPLAAEHHAAAQQAPTERADLATVFVPHLNIGRAGNSCGTDISAQNVGTTDGKIVLATWSGAGFCPPEAKGPFRFTCSGILRPGGAWLFPDNAMIPRGANSGVLFSLSLRRLSEIGAREGGDQAVADWVCDSLAVHAAGNAEEYAAFAIAFEDGEVYRGVPLDGAVGPPLAVDVVGNCLSNTTPTVYASAAYEALPAAGLGSPDPVTGLFEYAAGPIYVDDTPAPPALQATRTSNFTIQNAGTACATVEIQLRAEGECGDARTCNVIPIAPGEILGFNGRRCVGPGWRGSVWIKSDQPLAIVIDNFGEDGLTAYTGQPARTEPAGAPGTAAPGRTLFTPLVFPGGGAGGGQVEVMVQNLAGDRDARARVSFLDHAGAVLETRELTLCPRGTRRAEYVSTAAESAAFGGVRVESLADPADPAAIPAAISAVAELRAFTEREGETVFAGAVAVNLGPEAPGAEPPTGGAGSGGGAAVLAWPSAVRDLNWWGLTSELAVTNVVAEPGHTDVAVLLYDQNALLNVLCRRLEAGATASIDLQQTPSVIEGFLGSALVSAAAWTHQSAPPAAPRPLVGLSGLLVTRRYPVPGEDILGDTIGATVARPLMLPAGAGIEGWRTLDPLCPGERMPSPRPTPGPDPLPGPPAARAAEVHAPVVSNIAADTICDATLSATNRGPESAIVVALLWGEPGFTAPQCFGVRALRCSGLLEPGDTWRLSAQSSDGDLAGNWSASFYSFNTRTLGEIGVEPGSQVIAAETLCSALRQALAAVPNCPVLPIFRLAFRSGSSFADIPLDRVIGPPVDVVVERDCEPEWPLTVATRSRYTGIAQGDTTAIHPGTDPARGAYAYSLSHASVGEAGAVSVVYLQNAGLQPTSAALFVYDAGARTPGRLLRVLYLVPGETFPLTISDSIEPTWEGSIVIRSGQPLAVMVDELRPDGLRVHGAFGGDRPFDLNGDGRVDRADLALLDAALGALPGAPRWNLRYDLTYDEVIDRADRDWLLLHLDPDTATPTPTPTEPPTPTPTEPPPGPSWAIQLPWLNRSQ